MHARWSFSCAHRFEGRQAVGTDVFLLRPSLRRVPCVNRACQSRVIGAGFCCGRKVGRMSLADRSAQYLVSRSASLATGPRLSRCPVLRLLERKIDCDCANCGVTARSKQSRHKAHSVFLIQVTFRIGLEVFLYCALRGGDDVGMLVQHAW